MQLLNSYLDCISNGTAPRETRLEFWVADGSKEQHLVLIRAELPAWGSLGPLFYAFDLIEEEQLLAGVGRCTKGEPARPALLPPCQTSSRSAGEYTACPITVQARTARAFCLGWKSLSIRLQKLQTNMIA